MEYETGIFVIPLIYLSSGSSPGYPICSAHFSVFYAHTYKSLRSFVWSIENTKMCKQGRPNEQRLENTVLEAYHFQSSTTAE